MHNKPDFLVIGAQKCATTWLYECLKDHPQICLPKSKKEVEYIGGDLYNERGMDWYLSLIEHCGEDKIKGDVSVEYIINPLSPKILNDLNPALKFIISIRNPVDRALSALKWYIRKGEISDDHSEIKAGIENAINNFSLSGNIISNKYYDILLRGLYNYWIKNYFRYFRPDSFLIINYDNIQKNPEKTVQNVYSFLKVDSAFRSSSLQNKPKRNSNNAVLIQMERKFSRNKAVSFIVNKLHQVIPSRDEFFNEEKEIREMIKDFYERNRSLVDIS